jgi:E-phenylitaconyl-CoA hydratase
VVTGPLLVDLADAIATVTLHRPDRRNAIDTAMRAALSRTFAELDESPNVRVIVLTGTDPAFCAGVDQKESAADDRHVLARDPQSVSSPITACQKPIIAAVNGAAVGGGLELALACDLMVGSTAASFGLPEVQIASMPGSGGTQRLLHAVARPTAMRMLLTGERIKADEALRVGLLSDLFEHETFLANVHAIAERIASNAPLSIKAIKRSVAAADNITLSAGLAVERSNWALLTSTRDRAEARAAFRENRPAEFIGE